MYTRLGLHLRKHAEKRAQRRLEAGEEAAHPQHQVGHDERGRLESEGRHLGLAHGAVGEDPEHEKEEDGVQDDVEAAAPGEGPQRGGALDAVGGKGLDGQDDGRAELR